MIRKHFAAFALLAAFLFFDAGQSATAYPASSADIDLDGIPDEWERRGRGPLTPDMVRVGRRDLIIYVIRRGGISEATTRTHMERVARFYREIPLDNPDGTRGIFMTVVYGPEVAPELWGAVFSDAAIFTRYVRPEWRGIARTFLVETTPNEGGQTISPEYAAAGPPWQAIAHEIGHEIDNNHTPPNQPTGGVSPLWTSIMNYLYTYQYNGSGDAVRFSQGEFSRTELNETRLTETLPYARARLTFLERFPNNFVLETRGPELTAIDWNRNGVFDTGPVIADINDGVSVEGHWPSLTPDRTSGAPSLAVVSNRLVAVYPRLTTDPGTWRSADMSADPTGRYYATVLLASGEMSAPRAISAGGGGAPSDPSTVGIGNLLGMAYTQNRIGFLALYAMTETGVGARRFILADFTERFDQTVVASARLADGSTPVYLLGWDRASGRIRIATVQSTTSASGVTYRLPSGSYQDISVPGFVFRSFGPIGAAVDPLTGELVVVYHDRETAGGEASLRLARLRNAPTAWGLVDRRWVGAAAPFARTQATPSITLDPTTRIGSRSQINVYALNVPEEPNGLVTTTKYREIADRSQDDGWRRRGMIDQWNDSQSAMSAVRFGTTDAFALRWEFSDPRPNLLVIYRGTAITNETLRDHDDVRYIGALSLQRSLRRLRCYLADAERINFELSPNECTS